MRLDVKEGKRNRFEENDDEFGVGVVQFGRPKECALEDNQEGTEKAILKPGKKVGEEISKAL